MLMRGYTSKNYNNMKLYQIGQCVLSQSYSQTVDCDSGQVGKLP